MADKRIELVNSGTGRSAAMRSPFRANSTTLLLALLAIGVIIGVVHNRWRAAKRPDPLLSGVRVLTYPFEAGGTVLEAGLFNNWNAIFNYRRLEAENARLNVENGQLRTENETLHLQDAENIRLRAALKIIHYDSKPPLPATVIALLPSPHFDTITVSRGTRDGIAERTVARTADGLVGQVSDAGALTSDVMLLTDLNSAVDGIVRRDGKMRGVGVVQGTGRSQPLEMIDLKPDDDVRVGDTVVSSGYGGVFPPDIPIGMVSKVKTDPARFLKSATITPAAPLPGDLREVWLLKP